MDTITKAYMQMVTESFDSPLQTTKIPEDSMLHTMGAMSASMVGGTNFSMHKIPDVGYLVQFDKDGATEVHHIDEGMRGGYKALPRKAAMGFASTFAHHIKGLLDSGKTVRISAHHTSFDHFKNISDRLLRLHPQYHASEVRSSKHPITDETVKEWTIRREPRS